MGKSTKLTVFKENKNQTVTNCLVPSMSNFRLIFQKTKEGQILKSQPGICSQKRANGEVELGTGAWQRAGDGEDPFGCFGVTFVVSIIISANVPTRIGQPLGANADVDAGVGI